MSDRTTYRPPEGQMDRIKESAKNHGNSINSEIARLIDRGLEAEATGEVSPGTTIAETVSLLGKQLAEKDAQLAAKDEQIAALIDRSEGMAAAVTALGNVTEAMTNVASQAQQLHAIDLKQLAEATEEGPRRRGFFKRSR